MMSESKKQPTANIISFGKYRGQPVEVLAGDESYRDWVMAQNWFRERYPQLRTIIINNFREPSETPDHNALQAKFLDDRFCRRFAEVGIRAKVEDNFQRGLKWLAGLGPPPAVLEKISVAALGDLEKSTVEFEVGGWDVIIEVLWKGDCIRYGDCVAGDSESARLYLEIKPALGDDYPAVLRQMKARKMNTPGYECTKQAFLVIQSFTAQGATLEQVRRIFELSGYKLVLFSEIDELAF
jgi:hypothetical protein